MITPSPESTEGLVFDTLLTMSEVLKQRLITIQRQGIKLLNQDISKAVDTNDLLTELMRLRENNDDRTLTSHGLFNKEMVLSAQNIKNLRNKWAHLRALTNK